MKLNTKTTHTSYSILLVLLFSNSMSLEEISEMPADSELSHIGL
jgi:hypothetical protein